MPQSGLLAQVEVIARKNQTRFIAAPVGQRAVDVDAQYRFIVNAYALFFSQAREQPEENYEEKEEEHKDRQQGPEEGREY